MCENCNIHSCDVSHRNTTVEIVFKLCYVYKIWRGERLLLSYQFPGTNHPTGNISNFMAFVVAARQQLFKDNVVIHYVAKWWWIIKLKSNERIVAILCTAIVIWRVLSLSAYMNYSLSFRENDTELVDAHSLSVKNFWPLVYPGQWPKNLLARMKNHWSGFLNLSIFNF